MPITSPLLIGRESDLESLASALEESRRGQTRTVVISGEAGIGKTRLLAEFLSGLDEVTVLRGQCVDLDSDAPPYGPIVALLRSLAGTIGQTALLEAAGPGADALAILLPELRATPEAREAASGERLFDAVAMALEGAAVERPIVAVIEDLHWADQATLALLRFLVRVLERARLLVVVTYRSDELGRGHPLRGWLPELDRNRRVIRRELPRLTANQVRRLAIALAGRPLEARDLALVVARTDGVPFFVEELLGGTGETDAASALPDDASSRWDGVAALPGTLRDLLLARYEGLSDAAQRLLRQLAAGGVRVEHELLAAVSGTSAEALDEAAREAVAARVLEVDETSYSFRHALVREAVHDQLLPGERVRFHTAYARALEQRDDPSAVSYHWMAAHDIPAAFTASLLAMDRARASFANASAARLGERALELWDRVPDAESTAGRSRIELLAETAYILRNAGESERAVALVDEAIEAARAAGPAAAGADPLAELADEESRRRLARLLRDKASYLANLGQTGSITLLREALDLLAPHPANAQQATVLRANVLGELAARLMLDARFAEAIETADAAFAEAEQVGSRPRMSVAANIRGMARLSAGGIDAGLADLALAGELADGDDSARLRYWVNESDALLLIGRFRDAAALAEAGVDRARERGVERTSGVMLVSNVVAPLAALGETARAAELLDRALDLDPPIGFSAHLQRLKLEQVLWSGDVALAARLLRSWRTGLQRQLRIDAQSRLGLAAVAGEIALASGDLPGAWREVQVLFAEDHRDFPAYDLPLAAIAARILGRARASGVDLEPGGPQSGDPSAEAAADRARESVVRYAAWPSAGESAAAWPGTAGSAAAWPGADAYRLLVEAELAGPGGAGADPASWAAAVHALAAPEVPARLQPYARFRLAGALAATGDRVAARAEAQEAAARARELGLGRVVDLVTVLERRFGRARGIADPGVGGSQVRSGAIAQAGGSGSPDAGHPAGPHPTGPHPTGAHPTAAHPAGPHPVAAHPLADRLAEAGLTDRERQVLALLATGLSNRQIAETLFISAKTASVHVSNILRKTGTATRTEAAYLARALDPEG
ncbi:helix-turn-helix transcriptional regulator [Herbiconiux solani]|uniref:helix-turn-helix transcriptional regulator n=1 Tax=Herbiconiux solani TaxID=661329 RepID=UPI0008263461|nr:LuxR family transcriptional regulator [Herbiconiux solani]